MSDELIEPPDPELRRLFEAESRFPDAPPAMKARVWSGVQHHAGAAGGAGGAAGAGGLSMSAVALVAFVVGAGAGAGLYHFAASTPGSPAAIERPSRPTAADAGDPAAVTPPPVDAGLPAPVDAAPVDAAPADAAPRIADAAPAPAPRRRAAPRSTLARERALIDVARAALARGHAASALTAIERHARGFPDGRLAEEREGLRVLALAGAGRVPEARRAAIGFRARYPRSLLLRSIDAALGGRP